MTDVEDRFVDVNGLRIHYEVQGEGEPVVLVHGWPTHSAMWRRQIPVLAEQARVDAVDLAGFGRAVTEHLAAFLAR